VANCLQNMIYSSAYTLIKANVDRKSDHMKRTKLGCKPVGGKLILISPSLRSGERSLAPTC
jgi:hypothetical protein